jgi:chemotaxis protein MotB
MIKRLLSAIALIAIASLLFPSCIVSKKKYDEQVARANRLQTENERLTKELAQQKDLYDKLLADDNANKATIADQKSQIEQLSHRIDMLKDSINDQQSTIHELVNRVDELGSENSKTKSQLSNTNAQIEAQRKRLEQLQALIDQQKKATEALRKKISDALVGFNSNELTVTMKNGRVYISMQEGLLFPSGSAVVNPKGKEALAKVASVLNTSKEVNIDIEGHTDSVPIHSRQYEDNWALSTARATSIAHVLIDDYKVVPAKLVASGRSEYDPVATNSTPAGRALNRRTEIILEPKLDELMNLMDGK